MKKIVFYLMLIIMHNVQGFLPDHSQAHVPKKAKLESTHGEIIVENNNVLSAVIEFKELTKQKTAPDLTDYLSKKNYSYSEEINIILELAADPLFESQEEEFNNYADNIFKKLSREHGKSVAKHLIKGFGKDYKN